MSDSLSKAIGQRGWPLCRTYLLVLFESVVVEVEENAGLRSDRTLRWALGVHSGGEYEVLGGWPESSQHGLAWDQVFAELKVRGAERVRFVIASGLATGAPAMRVEFPNAISLPSTMELRAVTPRKPARREDRDGANELRTAGTARKAPTTSDAPAGSSIRGSAAADADERRGDGAQAPVRSFAMLASQLRSVLAAQEAAQNLQRRVCSAVARHGAFSGPANATAFAIDALIRAEQETLGAIATINVVTQDLVDAARHRGGRFSTEAPRL